MAESLPPSRKVRRPRRKTQRAAKGTGAAYFVTARQLWACAAELPRGIDGKRRRRIVYGKTEAEAHRRIADLKARHGGTLRPVSPQRLSDYVVPWLEGVRKRVRPKTYESYAWAWQHAAPLVGGVRFDKFDRVVVLGMFAELTRTGSSANTVRHIARVMQTVLQDAIADGVYVGLNPFSLVQKQKPRHTVERGRALSLEECRRFIQSAREDRLEAAWLLGLTAGLRIGEMFGLQWTDVDFDKHTVNIRRQALFVNGKLLIDDLKTADSLRLLPIGQVALDALHRRRQAADREGDNSIWVFSSANRNAPVNPNNARRRNFTTLIAAAEIDGKITPHDLRHSMNSLAGAAGIPEKVRSERLGHADSTITRAVYDHTISGQARDAAQRIDEFLDSSHQE